MLLGAHWCCGGVTGELVLLMGIAGGTGAVGGLQVEMTAQCWALLVQWASLGRSELESLAEDTASLGLPGAPGPSRDPPTPPHLPAAPPSPDEVCGDRRSGPWKNTMEGLHKGGFIQICLEFSGFA